LLLNLHGVIQLRAIAFTGYQETSGLVRDNNISMLAGLNLVYVFVVVHTYLGSQTKALRVGLFVLSVNSIFLLGLGVRQYVLPAILCAAFVGLARRQYVFRSARNFRLIVVAPLVGFGMLAIGVLRSGDNVSTNRLAYVLFAEANFNWLSAGAFITRNATSLWEFPTGYLAGLIGLVPTLLWPSKFQVMDVLKPDYLFSSPVGGQSIVATATSNFGVLGSVLFFFALGFMLRQLLLRGITSTFWMSHLICLLSLLPFMLFRDDASIFVKNWLFNMLIVPFILLRILPSISAAVWSDGRQRTNVLR
jgi:oligosaccharide repeat unit polymerase